MTTPDDWEPIEKYLESGNIWELPIVCLADEEGSCAPGRWEFEDENYDGDYWFAWHDPDGGPLGFTPTKFRRHCEAKDCPRKNVERRG